MTESEGEDWLRGTQWSEEDQTAMRAQNKAPMAFNRISSLPGQSFHGNSPAPGGHMDDEGEAIIAMMQDRLARGEQLRREGLTLMSAREINRALDYVKKCSREAVGLRADIEGLQAKIEELRGHIRPRT